jgi:HlyD family secretion protein
MKKKTIYIGAGIIALCVIFIISRSCSKKQHVSFETGTVKIGTVRNVVTATGTIQPVDTVSVGTQVSGVIDKIYVNYNSHVKKGQLLAELDKKTLLSELASAKAALDKAKADVTYQAKNYERIKILFQKGLIAQTDLDNSTNTYDQAKATLKSAENAYAKAKTNLSYASIYSPIDGIVESRLVDEGQTVAASFSTPKLFTIAKDLTQMQVYANIDEADIGQVKVGQHVTFTVDAFPDLTFNGEVTEIRLKPTTTSNVVTYSVIIKAPNPDTKLMPGMTANISIITEEAKDVLTMPSKAVRFSPDSLMMVAYFKSLPENERPKIDKIRGKKITFAEKNKLSNTRIWVKNGSFVHPINVQLGINDETNVEILSGELKKGDEVILSMSQSASADSTKSKGGSPFMPSPPKHK